MDACPFLSRNPDGEPAPAWLPEMPVPEGCLGQRSLKLGLRVIAIDI